MTIADAMRRAQTEALIDQKPSDVVLTRPTWLSDGAGGRTKSGASTLPPQKMRLVPASPITNQENQARVTADGRMVTPNWLLIGLPEQDIEPYDFATVLGHEIEVVGVSNVPTERLVAECWEAS